ncbi:uncharacterized protein EAE97_002020 [Botrytis byssoidea]|uniref:Uncharacterized protein n=1 Tax=Botrytis byssoidea TaxID=139641 RepID=A0A9P5ISY9_9HELO|nr:uncharacterized protein EAE97_002020 [Botrytis byssoidea]KAF7952523.1 hypothetical protein EAE97_002020 [Botrytis byssoidea]
MKFHRRFTEKVKAHPKYFQIFLVALAVAFIITILVVGTLSEPSQLLQLYAPSEEFDLYKVYFFKVCRSKINGINDGCHGYLPAVLSDDASIAGFSNLKIIFALFFISGLAHLAHGYFGIRVHLNDLHHPKIENAMAFMSFFTLLAAAIACPWILIDYRWQIQSVSKDEITVNVSTSIIGLGFTAVLFSLVSREILIVGTIKNERAIQAFSDIPINGEDTRRYRRDDGDSIQSDREEEAERSQIPVYGIRREQSSPISREEPASRQMFIPTGTRLARPPLEPSGAYVTQHRAPQPPIYTEYGRGLG